MDAEEFIQHYGVPGMKWGRRKSPSGYTKISKLSTLGKKVLAPGDPGFDDPNNGSLRKIPKGSSMALLPKRSAKPDWQRTPNRKPEAVAAPPIKKLSRRERRKQPKEISEDAAQFVAIKQKIKAKGVQSLTNKELETVNKRMQLQTSYNKNFPKKKNPVVEFFIDKAIADASELKINSFVGPRNPDAAVVAKTIFEIGRVVRESKKKKDQGGKSND